MSNRLSKGKALVGKLATDQPGFNAMGGIPFTSSATTAVTTAFKFSEEAVISSVKVKITSVSSSTNTISIGLATGTSSGGVGTALCSVLAIPSTGVWIMCPSTCHASLTFNYGSYLIASTSAGVTTLTEYSAGSTNTYRYLNYTCATTATTVGIIYPIFYELS